MPRKPAWGSPWDYTREVGAAPGLLRGLRCRDPRAGQWWWWRWLWRLWRLCGGGDGGIGGGGDGGGGNGGGDGGGGTGGGGGALASSRARFRVSAACRFSSIAASCSPVKVTGGTGAAAGSCGSGSGCLHAPQQKTAHSFWLSSMKVEGLKPNPPHTRSPLQHSLPLYLASIAAFFGWPKG